MTPCPAVSFPRSEQLQSKLENLSQLARRRKEKLQDNSAYLQFMWKADVVESWIADKEAHVKSEDFGRDLSTVQTLLTKQETFDAGEMEGWIRGGGGAGGDELWRTAHAMRTHRSATVEPRNGLTQ